LYFVANTSNRAQKVQARFRALAAHAEFWDPFTGKSFGGLNPIQFDLDLQPYESRIIVLSNQPHRPPTLQSHTENRQTDISQDWTVSFEGESQPLEMHTLTSWPDEPRLRYYSGRGTYRKSIDISAADLQPGHSVLIDFGEGAPVPFPRFPVEFDMRAYLESPVREAAQVFVNDQPAGYVWHPPFRVDVTPYVKQGKNEIRVVVGNTAINELAGTSLPNYRLLYSRYGQEFEPQGMRDLQPLPSGMLGHVTLIETSPVH